jgi:hypothetical protein
LLKLLISMRLSCSNRLKAAGRSVLLSDTSQKIPTRV